jgi:16S rRNA processing protein RimM
VTYAAKRLTETIHRGSGGQRRALEPPYLAVGRIVGAHGVRGELKVEILTELPERFGLLERVFIGPEDQEPVPWVLEGYRLHKGRALLKLKGCDDRTRAEILRWQLVQIPLQEALPLEEGAYYEYQILGLAVWTAAGEHLGAVVEIIATGANDVYVIDRDGKPDLLIPAIEEVIHEVDLDAGRMVITIPAGLS